MSVDKVTFGSVEVGQELPAVTRRVTQESFWRYAAASLDYNPVHCDPEWVKAARPFGLPETVAHGMMTISFMLTVVSNWAYPSLLQIATIDTKLLWPVVAGSAVTCTGVISEKHPICPGRDHVMVDLQAVNHEGRILAVGRTKVVFPA